METNHEWSYVQNVKDEIDGVTGVMNHDIQNLESRRREM